MWPVDRLCQPVLFPECNSQQTEGESCVLSDAHPLYMYNILFKIFCYFVTSLFYYFIILLFCCFLVLLYCHFVGGLSFVIYFYKF